METSAFKDALQIASFRYSNASFVVYVDECYGFPAIICSDPEHFPAIDTGRDTLTTIERSFIAQCQFSHDTMDYRPRLRNNVGVASHGDNEPVTGKPPIFVPPAMREWVGVERCRAKGGA